MTDDDFERDVLGDSALFRATQRLEAGREHIVTLDAQIRSLALTAATRGPMARLRARIWPTAEPNGYQQTVTALYSVREALKAQQAAINELRRAVAADADR